MGSGFTNVCDARFMNYRRTIWQTTQGSVGNNPFINESMLLVAGTERHLCEKSMELKELASKAEVL